jgi:hypothetical protein
VHLEQAGARSGDGVGHPDSGGGDLTIETADIGEELTGETVASIAASVSGRTPCSMAARPADKRPWRHQAQVDARVG